jgi:phage/plasmid-like protein (TIGR03299 family)
MTSQTIESLNRNSLIGYTSKRGDAWWRSRGIEDVEGLEPTHYEFEIPVEDVLRRLFNWQAEEVALNYTVLDDDGVTTHLVKKYKGIIRGDTHELLGIPGKDFQIHQYQDWLVDAVEIALGTSLKIGSAGVLDGGGRAYMQAELPETMEFVPRGGGEPILFRPFLTAATAQNSSMSTTYLTGAQAVVCDNTLSTALSGASSKVKISHRPGSLDRLATATEGLELVEKTAERFVAQLDKLTSTPVSDERWDAFVAKMTYPGSSPSKRSISMAEEKVRQITALWNYDPRVAPWAGTEYGVLAAINTYTHQVKTVRGATRADRNVDRFIKGGVDELDRSTLKLLASV